MVSRLSELALGEEGVVRVIQLSGSIKRRLLDLGCNSGCRILSRLSEHRWRFYGLFNKRQFICFA